MNTTAPDQAWILVQLITPRDTGLDAVLAKLQGIGLGSTDLASVYTSTLTNLQWTFTKATPMAAIQSTLASLTRLQSSLGAEVLNFSITGAQRSAASQPACPLPALVSDARKQADALATVVGLRAGAILSISDQPPPVAIAIYVPSAALPVIVDDSFLLGRPYIETPAPCTLTVSFRLF